MIEIFVDFNSIKIQKTATWLVHQPFIGLSNPHKTMNTFYWVVEFNISKICVFSPITHSIKWYKYWERWKSEYLCFLHSTIRWPLTYTLNCLVSFSIKIRMMQQIETTLWISDNSCDRSLIWKHFDRAENIYAPAWFQLKHEYMMQGTCGERERIIVFIFRLLLP